MESNLRPLTLGEILDRTAQLYRNNFLLFAGIAAVYSGFGLLLNLTILLPVTRSIAQPMTDGRQIGAFFAATGVVMLILFLIYGATVAATTRAVAWLHLGEPATIRAAYATTLPRLGRYLWLKFITTCMIVLMAIAAVTACAIPIVILTIVLKSSGAPGVVLMVLLFILMYAGMIFLTIWMALRYSLAIPACVMENLKARQAIRRSVELSKGSRGRIFVLWLLVMVIWIALFALTSSFFLIYPVLHHHALPIGLSVLQQFLSFLVNTFVVPISAIGATLFYYDQRIRKEGYDIEWMMQAAGLTVPAVQPVVADEPAVAASSFVADTASPEPAQPAPPEAEAAHE